MGFEIAGDRGRSREIAGDRGGRGSFVEVRGSSWKFRGGEEGWWDLWRFAGDCEVGRAGF